MPKTPLIDAATHCLKGDIFDLTAGIEVAKEHVSKLTAHLAHAAKTHIDFLETYPTGSPLCYRASEAALAMSEMLKAKSASNLFLLLSVISERMGEIPHYCPNCKGEGRMVLVRLDSDNKEMN